MKSSPILPDFASGRGTPAIATATKILIIIPLIFLSACFTGIESTKKISLSKGDLKTLEPSPEEILMADIAAQTLSEWAPGKEFFVVSDRAALLFKTDDNSYPDPKEIDGSVISFEAILRAPAPDGSSKAIIAFRLGNRILKYDTGKEYTEALSRVLSDELPMLVDADMLRSTASLLAGRKLWTRSPVWYDTRYNRIEGKKFVAVDVIDVIPGSEAFPALVRFNDNAGNAAMMYLNLGNHTADSRSFANLFYLSDPKLRYPQISDETWTLIQSGKLRAGMTKDECRLSIGSPDEVMSGHDYSQVYDLWKYNDGSMLRFADGLLVDFRH